VWVSLLESAGVASLVSAGVSGMTIRRWLRTWPSTASSVPVPAAERERSPQVQNRPKTKTLWLALVVFVFLAAGGAWWIGYGARRSSDFYPVAMPGILTGAGTLVLAGVTVFISLRQSQLDAFARREDAAIRANAEDQLALREAWKVIPSARAEVGGQTSIVVTNEGREPIIEVHLVEAWVDGADVVGATPGARWTWSPSDFTSLTFGGKTVGWYRSYLAPGHEGAVFEGSLNRTGPRQPAGADKEAKGHVQVKIAWTDVTGRHWSKHDSEEPVALDKPPPLRPPIGLEDYDESDGADSQNETE